MTTGSLQRKKNKWYAVVCFNINGKQTQKWINTDLPVTGNKRKAEKILNEKILEYSLIEQESEKPAQETKLLFCDFISDWIEIHRMNIENITYAGYKRILKQVYPYFKKLNVTLENLSPLHIQKYYAAKLQTLSPNTVLKHHALIRSALAYARKTNLVRENVADLVEKPKKQKFVGNFYNQEEIGRMLAIIKDSPIEMPVLLGIYFGLRRSEIVGLKWSAVNLTDKQLTVSHKVVPVSVDGRCSLEKSDKLKNKSSYRTLPFNDNLRNRLIELKRRQDENRSFCGSRYNHAYNEYVCVYDSGDIMQPNFITRSFKKLLDNNGLRVIRFHDLRHSCASLLLHLGYSMKEIQEWLGQRKFCLRNNNYLPLGAVFPVKTRYFNVFKI